MSDYDLSFFNKKEVALIKKLNTPAKIQDFINNLNFNFEEDGVETLMSPLRVLRSKKAHCFEGALLAVFLLIHHNYEAYLALQKSTKDDIDHMIVPFKINNLWGAISKTNHAVLRYREPVYLNLRELMMSYFHEFFLNSNGKKTFREYSDFFDIKKISPEWIYGEEDLWYIDKFIKKLKTYNIVPKNYINKLRKAEPIEIKAGSVVQYKKSK